MKLKVVPEDSPDRRGGQIKHIGDSRDGKSVVAFNQLMDFLDIFLISGCLGPLDRSHLD